MKFLRTFENFYLPSDMETDEQDYLMRNRKMQNVVKPDDDDEYCEPCADDDEMGAELPSFSEEDNMRMNRNEFEEEEEDDMSMRMPHIMRFEAKKTKPESYKKSGLKNPEKADRNKNNKIEGWEKAVAKKIEDSMEKKDKKELTPSQKKKLPEGLQKAIEAKKKK
jgi:hypothetical protein